MKALAVALAGATAILAACSRGADSIGATVADSAGVRTITYAQRPESIPFWQLDSSPLVSIGVADGEPPYVLSRVVAVIPHGSGHLVADGGSGELRLFDERGVFVRGAGGAGEGPGEFAMLRWIGGVAGDSVYAWDLRLSRITVFDPELKAARVQPLVLEQPGVHVVVGALEDGALLVNPFGALEVLPPSPKVIEGEAVYALAWAGEGTADTVVRVRSRPVYVEPEGRVTSVPFGSSPSVVVGTDVIWAGSGGRGTVSRYSRNGKHELEVRLPPGARVTEDMIAASRDSRLRDHGGSERLELERVLESIPVPERLPAFDLIRLDDGGNVWMRDFFRPDASMQRWWIMNRAGELVGRMDMPRGADRPLHFS